jgi:hypothetical protein
MIFGSERLGKTITRYRELQLGASVASIATLTGLPAAEVKTIHTTPALLQVLEWPNPYAASRDRAAEGVQRITFSFYNDQLFRLVIRHERDRSDTLMDTHVARISAMYGTVVKPLLTSTQVPVDRVDVDATARLAAWSDGHHTAVLYGPSRASGFRIVVSSIRLDRLARTARADALTSPRREAARDTNARDDDREAAATARLASTGALQP